MLTRRGGKNLSGRDDGKQASVFLGERVFFFFAEEAEVMKLQRLRGQDASWHCCVHEGEGSERVRSAVCSVKKALHCFNGMT